MPVESTTISPTTVTPGTVARLSTRVTEAIAGVRWAVDGEDPGGCRVLRQARSSNGAATGSWARDAWRRGGSIRAIADPCRVTTISWPDSARESSTEICRLASSSETTKASASVCGPEWSAGNGSYSSSRSTPCRPSRGPGSGSAGSWSGSSRYCMRNPSPLTDALAMLFFDATPPEAPALQPSEPDPFVAHRRRRFGAAKTATIETVSSKTAQIVRSSVTLAVFATDARCARCTRCARGAEARGPRPIDRVIWLRGH